MGSNAGPGVSGPGPLQLSGEPKAAVREVHISSLVVHSRPDRAVAIADFLQQWPDIDVHGGVDEGRLVVTLETATEGEIVERLNAIQVLEGVLAATLVFHHSEPVQEGDSLGPVPT